MADGTTKVPLRVSCTLPSVVSGAASAERKGRHRVRAERRRFGGAKRMLAHNPQNGLGGGW